MKKNEFNKIRDEYYKKNVVVNTYKGKQIIGKYDSEFRILGIILVGNEEILVKDIEKIDFFKDDQIYKYVIVVFGDDKSRQEYSYRTTINNINDGDLVLVDRQGSQTPALVVDVGFYTRDSVPYPVEKTKEIISVIQHYNGRDNDSYRTYDEIEKQVIEKLTDLGVSYKKSLRIILMLRTYYDSDKQCRKMLDFLKNIPKKDRLIEIEKYARLLADEENWYSYSIECPNCDDRYISIIDCLEKSDEEAWNKNVKKEFKDTCKNCKWYNPLIEKEVYESNVPTPFSRLTLQQTTKLDYEDIIAIAVAEDGALGCPKNIEIIAKVDNELKEYQTYPNNSKQAYRELYKVIPWLKNLKCGIGYISNIVEGWKHINIGFGNHLIVRDSLYEDLKRKVMNESESEIYKSWKSWVAETKEINTPADNSLFIKGQLPAESIYEFIEQNITSKGTLPSDFSLKPFKHPEDEDFIFADGMLDFYMECKPDNDTLVMLKNLIKSLDEDTVTLKGRLVDEYYAKNKGKRVLGTIGIFLNWIRKNENKFNKSLIFQWGLYMTLCGKEVETVKIGISLLGLFNITDNHYICSSLKKLALSDEFTLYCDNTLSNLENINEVRFDLVKKLHSYGKIHLVPKLEISSDEQEQWLFRYGCANDADNGWLALDIADKIDLPKIVRKTIFTEDDVLGLYNIMDGLMEDEPQGGILVYKYSKKLFKAIISKKSELYNNIKYLHILGMIKQYLEEEREDFSNIENILNSSKVKEVLIANIKPHEKLNDILYISSFIQNFDIYNQVYEVFKENLKSGYETEAIHLSHYLIYDNKDNIHEILDLLKTHLNYSDKLGKPQPIISFDDSNLVSIIRQLSEFPLEGIPFVIQGLMCKTMYPRKESLDVIEKWVKLQEKPAKEYLPADLYAALNELKNQEVIKDYKEKINEILGIEEELSNYEDPKVRYVEEKNEATDNVINLYSGDIDRMFFKHIIARGKEYYDDKMVFDVVKKDDTYIGHVQGSQPNIEYRVSIKVDKNDNILSMRCSCLYKSHCKHEYATLLHIRNKD